MTTKPQGFSEEEVREAIKFNDFALEEYNSLEPVFWAASEWLKAKEELAAIRRAQGIVHNLSLEILEDAVKNLNQNKGLKKCPKCWPHGATECTGKDLIHNIVFTKT